MVSPLAASSLMIRTTRVQNRPRRLPICTNCATKIGGAISGDKVSSFSCWSHPPSPSPWALLSTSPPPSSAPGSKKEKALKKQGIAQPQRPPKPPANPAYPTKQQRALRLLERFHAQHPALRVHCITADALYGT